MDDELRALEAWAAPFLAKLSPAQRRAVLVDIGRELRRSQQARIASQTNPDGSEYAPRKARQLRGKGLREKAGRVKRQAMFRKLRTAKFLKVEVTAEGLAIGFSGRAAYLARVHQEGLAERVARGGPSVTYPVRQLLGLTGAEREKLLDQLLTHLAK